MTRRPIPKGLRFEILKRDAFTCQYCGAEAPDVRLHVDHKSPAARGGSDHAFNLVTACTDCNLGKAARSLAVSMEERVIIRNIARRWAGHLTLRQVCKALEGWQDTTAVPITVMIAADALSCDWDGFNKRYWDGVTDYWASFSEAEGVSA